VKTVVEDDCTRAAVRYVDIQIAEAKDPQLKANLEMEKARTVLRIETGCRNQKWGPDVTGCYKAARTQAELQVCTKRLQPVPAAPPANKDEAKKKDENKADKKAENKADKKADKKAKSP
jgi:hypothetical protein